MKIIQTLLIVSAFIYSSCNTETNNNTTQIPDSGDLTTTFSDPDNNQPDLSPEQLLEQERERMLNQGWIEDNLENGLMPSCYNFSPNYNNSIDNYLKINVGSGTDVVAKLMSTNTGKCIRYVFINRSSSYTIRNIPEGIYFLKLAYGKDWLSKIESKQCIGRFLINPMYEKGEDILDFNFVRESNGYSIPSYEISLDVISTQSVNTFSTSQITEAEFNN